MNQEEGEIKGKDEDYHVDANDFLGVVSVIDDGLQKLNLVRLVQVT